MYSINFHVSNMKYLQNETEIPTFTLLSVNTGGWGVGGRISHPQLSD